MRRQLRVGDDGNVELIATADGHFLTDRSRPRSRPHPALHSLRPSPALAPGGPLNRALAAAKIRGCLRAI